MHLWTRTRQIDVLQGPQAFTFAVDIAQHAASTIGLEVVPWTAVYGLPLGTMVYSVQVDSQAAMAAALTALAADEGYRRRIEESGSKLCGTRRGRHRRGHELRRLWRERRQLRVRSCSPSAHRAGSARRPPGVSTS